MRSPKTITSFLLTGDPLGVKLVELSGWIGKAMIIPRSLIESVKIRPELTQVGVYFLFGVDEQDTSCVYVGEAEKLRNRLAQHTGNNKKEFWQTAIVFLDRGKGLTKGDVKFLESQAIRRIADIKRYTLTNGTNPDDNNLPEHRVYEMMEFLTYMELLLSSSWFPALTPLITTTQKNTSQKLYHATIKWFKATGYYTPEGFLVCAWSTGPKELSASEIQGKYYARKNRPKLIEKGIIKESLDWIVFLQDYLFSSPSSAGCIAAGRSTNWRTFRKDEQGKTLADNERQS